MADADTAERTQRSRLELAALAERGDAAAQSLLGRMHFVGGGGPVDLAEARRLLRLAAAQGDTAAQQMLGHLLYGTACADDGGEVPASLPKQVSKDLPEARRMFGLAAEQGSRAAQSMLGTMCMCGEGGPVDLVEARRQFGLAVAQGQADAQEQLDLLGQLEALKADGMMNQLLAEEEHEKDKLELKGLEKAAAKSAKSAKRKASKKKRGEPATATSLCADHELEVRVGSLQVSAGPPDAAAAAAVLAPVVLPVVLNRPLPPPASVTSLADAQFNTGRPEAPESTIGGQSTCIICFVNPKSHAAVPCGHQCACGDCSAKMKECPVCRDPAQIWMHVRVA